jgi:hypothetical protein
MPDRKSIETVQVWVGMHGEEREPGEALHESLHADPLAGVSCDIANPRAFQLRQRYIDVNLALCLQNPGAYAGTYEAQLVPGILEKSQQSDLTVDIHQEAFGEHDYAFVGPRVYPHVLGFIALVGINTIVVAETGIQGQQPGSVLLDIASQSQRNDVAFWRNKLAEAKREGLPIPPLETFRIYTHTDLMPEETRLVTAQQKQCAPRQELPAAAELLGVDRPVYAAFGYNEGYEGIIEVIATIEVDDITVTNGTLYLPTLRTL